jgi:hypothetical protein
MELWEKTQKAIDNNKELYGKRQKTTVSIKYWSHGLVKCGNCGKSLVSGGGEGYYQCNGYAKGTCKISHSIKIERLEALVLEQLRKTFRSSLEFTVAPKNTGANRAAEYALLKEQLEKFAHRQARIKTAYMDGIDTIEEYRENKAKLESGRMAAENKLNDLRAGLFDSAGQGNTPITKQVESAYALLNGNDIPLGVKYKASHFLISKIVFVKHERALHIEYK